MHIHQIIPFQNQSPGNSINHIPQMHCVQIAYPDIMAAIHLQAF
jgi:hypothetical protein